MLSLLSQHLQISIHPPREGWDLLAGVQIISNSKFQSTHPVRGGTWFVHYSEFGIIISIHPPREGWDRFRLKYGWILRISIHPPREGWDLSLPFAGVRVRTFQSTHPVRGGTTGIISTLIEAFISIHPPREGWDLLAGVQIISNSKFQSTHPVRGGT